jgi:hypothetical protein
MVVIDPARYENTRTISLEDYKKLHNELLEYPTKNKLIVLDEDGN